MAHVIAVLAVVFGFLVGGSSASAAEPPNDIAAAVYAYEAPAYEEVTTYAAVERGPPVAIHHLHAASDIDSGSRGVSVRPSGRAARATYGYDATATRSQVDNTAGTTREPTAAIAGDSSSFQRWRVAAKSADNVLPGLPASAPKPLGLGSTGRTTPKDLTEQLAMTEVRSAPGGAPIPRITMSDPRWMASDGWVKMQQIVNGVNIHYGRNTVTGAVDDFKFVMRR